MTASAIDRRERCGLVTARTAPPVASPVDRAKFVHREQPVALEAPAAIGHVTRPDRSRFVGHRLVPSVRVVFVLEIIGRNTARKIWRDHLTAKAAASVRRPQFVPPLFPTSAQPGSEAKMQVMAARIARHEHPHHPDDATARINWRDWAACFRVSAGGGR